MAILLALPAATEPVAGLPFPPPFAPRPSPPVPRALSTRPPRAPPLPSPPAVAPVPAPASPYRPCWADWRRRRTGRTPLRRRRAWPPRLFGDRLTELATSELGLIAVAPPRPPSPFLCRCGLAPTVHHLPLRFRTRTALRPAAAKGPEPVLGGWPEGQTSAAWRSPGAGHRRCCLLLRRRRGWRAWEMPWPGPGDRSFGLFGRRRRR